MVDCFFTKCFTALQQLWHSFLGEMFSTVVMLEEKASIIFCNNEGSIKCAFFIIILPHAKQRRSIASE